MARKPNPTSRRRQLGKELRRIRESLGVERDEIAEYLGCQLPKVSKVETGKLNPSPAELRLLAIRYDLDKSKTQELLDVGKEARRRGWWTSYGNAVPDWLKDYVGLESDAAEIRNYEAELIHGLLQTQEYTRAVIQAWPMDTGCPDIEHNVGLRMKRQEVLEDESTRYHAIVNEASLYRTVGSAAIMRDQLNRLLDLHKRNNITIQVLPQSNGAHPAMGSSFTILGFADAADPLVYLEDLTTGLYLEKEIDVERYTVVFRRLSELAAGAKESRRLIETAVKQLE